MERLPHMTLDPISALRSAFQAAVDQADPQAAVAQHISNFSKTAEGRVIVVAAGKAAPAMLRGAMAHLGQDIEAICVTHKENQHRIDGIPFFNSAHPIPDDVGLQATQKIAEILGSTTENDQVRHCRDEHDPSAGVHIKGWRIIATGGPRICFGLYSVRCGWR